MKKRIYGPLLLVTLLSLLLTLLLSAVVFKNAFDKQIGTDIEQSARLMAAAYENEGSVEELARLSGEGLRVTLVAPDGTIRYDSIGATANHADRPEIQAALASGSGSAVRVSATAGYYTYYFALRLNSGDVLRVAREAESLYAAFNRAIPWLLLIFAAMLILSFLLTVYLTRRLVRPLEEMAEDLGAPGQEAPYPELEPFADRVRRQREKELETQRMRQEFTANVSHELKTPLTSISGYAEMIETGMARPGDVPIFAGKIRAETQRMLTLIGDIIQLGELDAGGGEKFSGVPLLTLCQNVADSLSLTAEKKHINIRVEGSETVVYGARGQLWELIYNLCDNGIRYNREGGSVTLSVGKQGKRPCLSVSDTGIGIPPEHQSHVFERFYRVDKSRSRESGGTGLGLAIVKHIALRHGAELRLESEPDRGTRVTVLFKSDGSPTEEKQ
ncbi:MAG: ATP-binding protein [Clostridiaceae bacterium]|nr:ATP-binding protein [Clostridiaceae bacterium]